MPVGAQEGAGITIKPATVEELMERGETATFTVLVRNESAADQTFFLGKRDIVGVTDGNVPVYAADGLEQTGFELSGWIQLPSDTVFVPAGGEVPVQFAVTVPGEAAPGGHFAGIFVSLEAPQIDESGAAIGYQVANIVSIRVAGEVNERADIRQFSTENYIYGSPTVNFLVRIENSGNTLVRPRGPMQITNMFGKVVSDETLIFNDASAGVFPGATREFTLEWKGEGTGFGRYEAVVSPNYGEAGSIQNMSSTVTFWILPMNIIGPALISLLVIFVVVFVAVKLYVRRKLAYYAAPGGRKLVRRQSQGSPLLLVFMVMLTVTALFFIVLLILFS